MPIVHETLRPQYAGTEHRHYFMRHWLVPGAPTVPGADPTPEPTTDAMSGLHHERFGEWPSDEKLASYWYRFLEGWKDKRHPDVADVVDERTPGPEPTPTVPPPVDTWRRIEGQLRIGDDGRGYVDNKGAILPVLCHAGDLLSVFVRDRAKARAAAAIIASAGYMGVRTWTILGGEFWRNREVGPDDWSEHLLPFVEMLREHRLAWLVSQGDICRIAGLNQIEAMRKLGSMLAPVSDVIAGVDAGNENWNVAPYFDMETSVRALRAFLDRCAVPIRSVTDSPEEDLTRHHASISTVWDVHGYRQGHWWDKVRHVFSMPWEGNPPRRLGKQSEPPGEGASVIHNPHELDAEFAGLLTAQHLMCRQLSVFMSGPGVMLKDPEDFGRLKGFHVPPKIARILPVGVMRWGAFTHGGDSQRGTRFLSTSHDTELRADQAWQTGSNGVVAVCYGPSDRSAIVEKPLVGAVYGPKDGSWIQDVSILPKGTSITWPGKGGIFVGGRMTQP